MWISPATPAASTTPWTHRSISTLKPLATVRQPCSRPADSGTTAQEMGLSNIGYAVGPRFAENGKLYAGWSTASQSNKAGTGILLWREE